MNLALVGPLPPQPSGISDYHYTLLRHLRPHVRRLVAVVDQGVTPDLAPGDVEAVYRAPDMSWWRSGAVLPLYQMGNHIGYHRYVHALLRRFPGVTVLHDGNLLPFYNALTLGRDRKADYVREVGFAMGEGGYARAWTSLRTGEPLDPDRCPMLARVARSSLGVVVHSTFMREKVLRAYPEARVAVMPLIDMTPQGLPELAQSEAKRALGYAPDDLLLGVVGFVAPTKRVTSVLRALKALLGDVPSLHLACVGEIVEGYDVEAHVDALGLRDRVRMTGYVTAETFHRYVRAVDVGVNLRYPTSGESSAALARLMAAGKPALVTDAGAFAELPADAVWKVPHDGAEVAALVGALRQLLGDQDLRQRMGRAARAYVRDVCAPEAVAQRYLDFMREVVRGV